MAACPGCAAPVAGGDPSLVCCAACGRMFVESRVNRAPTAHVNSPVDQAPAHVDSPVDQAAPTAQVPILDGFDYLELDDAFRARFEVLGLLGRGATGVVLRARGTVDGRAVALKLLRDVGHDSAVQRLGRERDLLARLRHPHVVELLDIGEHRGVTFLVLELVEGGTLGQRLAAGPLPPDEALELAHQILDGLTHCHEHGIVHRDLKPDNLLFDAEHRLKIADLGLARALDSRTLTQDGCMVGTPRYMAPEVLRGEPAGASSDVYAVAAILFEMLAGRPAFAGDSIPALMRRILVEPPASLAEHCPDVPAPIAEAILHALDKDPRARPQSARAFAAALTSTLPAHASPDAPPDPKAAPRTGAPRNTAPRDGAPRNTPAHAPARDVAPRNAAPGDGAPREATAVGGAPRESSRRGGQRGAPGGSAVAPASAAVALVGIALAGAVAFLALAPRPRPSPPPARSSAAAAPLYTAPVDADGRLDALDRAADFVAWRADLESLDELLITQELGKLSDLARGLRRKYEDLLARARVLDAELAPPPGRGDGVPPVLRLRVAGLIATLAVRSRHLADRVLTMSRATQEPGALRGLTVRSAASPAELAQLDRGAALLEPALRAVANVRPLSADLRRILAAAAALGDAQRELVPPEALPRSRATLARVEAALLALPDAEAPALADLVLAVWTDSPAAARDPAARARLLRGQAALRRLMPLASPDLRPALELRRIELENALRS